MQENPEPTKGGAVVERRGRTRLSSLQLGCGILTCCSTVSLFVFFIFMYMSLYASAEDYEAISWVTLIAVTTCIFVCVVFVCMCSASSVHAIQPSQFEKGRTQKGREELKIDEFKKEHEKPAVLVTESIFADGSPLRAVSRDESSAVQTEVVPFDSGSAAHLPPEEEKALPIASEVRVLTTSETVPLPPGTPRKVSEDTPEFFQLKQNLERERAKEAVRDDAPLRSPPPPPPPPVADQEARVSVMAADSSSDEEDAKSEHQPTLETAVIGKSVDELLDMEDEEESV